MNAVGVHGAIFISAFSMYRYDTSYAVEVQQAHPDRLALVKPVDSDDPEVVDLITDWKNTSGAVGIRIDVETTASCRGGTVPPHSFTELSLPSKGTIAIETAAVRVHNLVSASLAGLDGIRRA